MQLETKKLKQQTLFFRSELEIEVEKFIARKNEDANRPRIISNIVVENPIANKLKNKEKEKRVLVLTNEQNNSARGSCILKKMDSNLRHDNVTSDSNIKMNNKSKLSKSRITNKTKNEGISDFINKVSSNYEKHRQQAFTRTGKIFNIVLITIYIIISILHINIFIYKQ